MCWSNSCLANYVGYSILAICRIISRDRADTKLCHHNPWFYKYIIVLFSYLIVIVSIFLGTYSLLDKRLELIHVSSLDVNRTRTREAANKTLARLHPSHSSSTSLLDLVVTAPSHEMTVVYNVLFTSSELFC